MNNKKLFEQFDNGKLSLPQKEINFSDLKWNKHPTFEGVELKHIITSNETNGKFSYHLVKIAPNKAIKLHVHENQLETHEVLAGNGYAINDGSKLNYEQGIISIFPKNIPHEVYANDEGLYIFAKFFPALV